MAPLPLNRSQRLAQCDLAGIATVASFRKTEDGRDLAKLAFLELHKGSVRDASGRPAPFAYVAMRDRHDPRSREPVIAGGWSDEDSFEVGESVLVYLNWSERERAYVTAWINAVAPTRTPAISWREGRETAAAA